MIFIVLHLHAYHRAYFMILLDGKLFPSSITVYAYGRIKHIKYKHTWRLAICKILLLEINLVEFARRKIHAEHLLEAAILFRT